MTANNNNFSENFKKSYTNLYNLHPQIDNEEFKLKYLKVDWFFPNHLNNLLDNIKSFSDKYFNNINMEIALFGGLFHDAGLVYKRDSSDPKGHENRSADYAILELSSLGYDNDFIEKVCECIKATELDYKTELPEALLVRNADAYSHLTSMHFFGKANFSKDIHDFIDWFDHKSIITFSKLTIEELIRDMEPLINYYKGMISNYSKNRNRDFLGEIS